MNFFEHQRQARRHTLLLVALFVLAVLSLIIAAVLLSALFLGFIQTDSPVAASSAQQLNLEMILLISLLVLLVVGGGSWYKTAQLAAGGEAVAKMMGASRVMADTQDPKLRRYYHVVEEMALAAGMQMPKVFVMQQESGINAFAAGYKLEDAAIAVTQGALDNFNREELQGVIAHEFSHVLNGDMRLNIRMIAYLHGIMLIGLIGYYLLHSARFGTSRRREQGNIGFLAFAVGLIAIGYGGMFFGNLIRAAMSREREYLADASAVQFTRNPHGIGNALIKIAQHANGSRLASQHTEEVSHMLFGSGKSGFLQTVFATHPPISKRIKRVLPSFNLQSANLKQGAFQSTSGNFSHSQASGFSAASAAAATVPPKSNSAQSNSAQAATALAAPNLENAFDKQQLSAALKRRKDLPKLWYNSCHFTNGARAVIYALLLSEQPAVYRHQLLHIKNLDSELLELCVKLKRTPLAVKYKINLVILALPQLEQIKRESKDDFLSLVDALIRADKKINIFEWSLMALLQHQFNSSTKPNLRAKNLQQLARECAVLFSILAVVDNKTASQQAAFASAKKHCQLQITAIDSQKLNLNLLQQALQRLDALKIEHKQILLEACILCIEQDGTIDNNEYNLLQVIANSLSCPIPAALGTIK